MGKPIPSPPSKTKPSDSAWCEFDHPVDCYARDVLSGTFLAGPSARLACERHLTDRAKAAAGSSPWRFDPGRADLILEFFRHVLCLPDVLDEQGQPKPFVLEPTLVFIAGSLFGWVGPDGYRRFREAFIEMGKGNAKTPFLAGMGLYGLVMDDERAPEIYAAAVTRDQAQIMFRDAVRIVQSSPELPSHLLHIAGIEAPHNISNRQNLGFFRPFSREQGLKSGPRPSMALVDEVHEHPTPEVINKMKAGFKFRKQPLLACITNSGFNRTTICYEMHQHGQAVVNGTLSDDQFFAYICDLDEGDRPLTDESCWKKANPLLGVTITEAYLRRQVQNAINLPSEQNTVLRLNFCQWTEQDQRWLDMAQWDACHGTVDLDALVGQPCYAGLDLASTRDVTAFVLAFPSEDDDTIDVVPFFWVPEETLQERVQRDRVPYDAWARDGFLRTTPGNVCDYDRIREDIRELAERFEIREIAYDRWGATQLITQLESDGAICSPLGQGFASMSAPTKELEKHIVGQQVRHGGHPVLRWMAANVAVEQDAAGNVKPSKRRSRDKIDGIVALVMAVDRLTRYLHEPSVYDSEGIFVV